MLLNKYELFGHTRGLGAVLTIIAHLAVRKFGDVLGAELEPVFSGLHPILEVKH